MKKLLFVVANIGFQDDEFGVPYRILSEQGFQCEIASGKGGVCEGVFGREKINDSLSFDKVRVWDYEILVFVGGGGAYEEYFQNQNYLNLALQAKAIAAICIAPSILSDTGLFVNLEITGWDDGVGTQIAYLRNNGAIFVDQEVVQSENIITANGPMAAPAFGWKIVDYLSESSSSEKKSI